jgi:transcriptional regulator with PAS, ATPase and Fis domain
VKIYLFVILKKKQPDLILLDIGLPGISGIEALREIRNLYPKIYERGAFTGARASGKRGLIEETANGTLFLDEVGDLSPEAQVKLLRFLETGEFYRVGETKKLNVQARVVSATNKDIENLAVREIFRKDLYYRLGVIKVKVPSLNERPGDILPLAKNFLLPEGVDFTSIQESFERFYIKEALRLANGNESKAAQLLNINHHTFRRRKKKLQIK